MEARSSWCRAFDESLLQMELIDRRANQRSALSRTLELIESCAKSTRARSGN